MANIATPSFDKVSNPNFTSVDCQQYSHNVPPISVIYRLSFGEMLVIYLTTKPRRQTNRQTDGRADSQQKMTASIKHQVNYTSTIQTHDDYGLRTFISRWSRECGQSQVLQTDAGYRNKYSVVGQMTGCLRIFNRSINSQFLRSFRTLPWNEDQSNKNSLTSSPYPRPSLRSLCIVTTKVMVKAKAKVGTKAKTTVFWCMANGDHLLLNTSNRSRHLLAAICRD